MCTATWTRTPGGYDLFFNRDERRTRMPARPPSVHERDGVAFIAPVDGDAGGTWLAVNAFGLTLGILNHYPAEPSAPVAQSSRGLLVFELADSASVAEVSARLATRQLASYRPFFLIAVDPSEPCAIHVWDGFALSSRAVRDEEVLPVSTSSFDTEIVLAHRRTRFAALRAQFGPLNADLLAKYHTSREERGDAYSVLMRRPDAETVSLSHVSVGPKQVAFHYWTRAEIDAGMKPAWPVVLPRA
jgi:hypothetical protein